MIDQSAGQGESAAEPEQGIDESRHLLNRELSWLRFNLRVLEEAEDKGHPLLERVKFLAIFATNLDEFFMIRVSGLHRQVAGGVVGTTPDGMTPSEQILTINRQLMIHYERYDMCWKQDVLPRLAEAGIRILHYAELGHREREAIQGYFQREIFPVLTPL
ncbi:MAG: RNA degradosome polyphosphate kinase, partial [Nitrospira sp.]